MEGGEEGGVRVLAKAVGGEMVDGEMMGGTVDGGKEVVGGER